MIRLGFTGTSKGLTVKQQQAFRRFIRTLDLLEFHHGDCVGADEQAHAIMRDEWPKVPILGHIPIKEEFRAYCDFDEVYPAKPYLARDRDIAEMTDWLVVGPRGFKEVQRSGTWATKRYAEQARSRVIIIWPDGRIR